MTAVTLTTRPRPQLSPERALDAAARLWFAVAAVGLGLFLVYIVGVYGASILGGDFAAWNRNRDLIVGHVPGDTMGNLAFAVHMALAAAVTGGGMTQLVPGVRSRWPAAHRWTGRVFLLSAALASGTGVYMVWARSAHLGLWGAVAITGNALLIVIFGALAWRGARAGAFAAHRRWALRTFMVANGVWFLRVGFPPLGLLSLALTGAPPTMDGPLFIAWNFGCYLLPLAVLELYFFAQRGRAAAARYAVAAGLIALTATMAFGIVVVWLRMFAPVLARA